MRVHLVNKLAEWNGKQIEPLLRIYDQYASSNDFWECLVSICKNQEPLQRAATWLIKHHYDKEHKLPEYLEANFLKLCDTLKHWEAKLHLLQLLPFFNLSHTDFTQIDLFLSGCLKNENKFVRAWAYHGYYELSKTYPEIINELRVICERAMETESPSVKAKVRKILIHIGK